MTQTRVPDHEPWAVTRRRLLRAVAAWVALAVLGIGMSLVLGMYLVRARTSLWGSSMFLLSAAGGAISALTVAVAVLALLQRRAPVLLLTVLACAQAIVDLVAWWSVPGIMTIPGVALLAQAYAVYQLARISRVLAGRRGAKGD